METTDEPGRKCHSCKIPYGVQCEVFGVKSDKKNCSPAIHMLVLLCESMSDTNSLQRLHVGILSITQLIVSSACTLASQISSHVCPRHL